jgi:hypothetical protein
MRELFALPLFPPFNRKSKQKPLGSPSFWTSRTHLVYCVNWSTNQPDEDYRLAKTSAHQTGKWPGLIDFLHLRFPMVRHHMYKFPLEDSGLPWDVVGWSQISEILEFTGILRTGGGEKEKNLSFCLFCFIHTVFTLIRVWQKEFE